MSILEDAITKFGGPDEAYKEKLKTHIAGSMGYSNYVNKANEANNKPLSLNLKGDITPQGVKSLVGGAVNMKDQERGTYGKIAGQIDSTAGQLASSQIAREKAAAAAAAAKAKAVAAKKANARGLANGVVFRAEDDLDVALMGAVQKAWNVDEQGNRTDIKSLQQIESELGEKFSGNIGKEFEDRINKISEITGMSTDDVKNLAGDPEAPAKLSSAIGADEINPILKSLIEGVSNIPVNPTTKQPYTKEEINERIQSKLPKDYIGNEEKYMQMMRGYSEKEAEANVYAMNYYDLSGPEKLISGIANPQMTKILQDEPGFPKAMNDINEEGETGAPKYSYEEIKRRNPDVTESVLKQQAIPKYKKTLDNSIKQTLDSNGKDDYFINLYNGEVDGNDKTGFEAVKNDPEYKDIKQKAILSYGDILSDSEIEMMLLKNINDKINEPPEEVLE